MSLSPEYLAGFIDADGNITICESQNNWHATLRVDSTFLPILEEIQQEYGGKLYETRNNKVNPRAKKAHVLHWSGRFAKSVLEAIKPYLRIKYVQCCLAIELIELQEQGSRGKRLTEEERDTRSFLHTEILHLNRRGA